MKGREKEERGRGQCREKERGKAEGLILRKGKGREGRKEMREEEQV